MRKIRRVQPSKPAMPKRKRVTAYARVSSGKDAMLHSLSAQVSYYSDYIQRHGGWEYAGVYADEAITGTKDDRREFQRMLEDCRRGKIDMVITKSITRFARNTVIMLEVVRELKQLGIDIFFEKENIHTLSGDGELMLTVLSSFAQEESRSVSENCKWRLRHKFAEGRPSSTTMLGYKLVDGVFMVEPAEAEIVRMIYNDFLSGMGKTAIVKKLLADKVPTKRGDSWTELAVSHILRNEKYIGDMLLQKTFSKDHISKKKCFNKGELPMYYVENSHEAIIDKDTFQKVQAELDRRAAYFHPSKESPGAYPFAGKIICGQCGNTYRRKIGNAGSKYARPVWICTTFNKMGKAACPSQQIPESILMELDPGFEKLVIPKANTIIVVMPDGSEVTTHWEHKSRRESWTDEMREAARQKHLEYLKGGRA